MANELSRELIIPFGTFETRGIQRDMSISITSSFFFDIYAQAFKLVELIDKSNEQYEKSLEKNKGCVHFEQELDDFQNVIAFTGRRGTGKTSSMISFLDKLSMNSFKCKDDYFKDKKYSFDNKGFYALPYTDASMLSKNDDIFETIISKMLSSLDHEMGDRFVCSHNSVNECEIKKVREEICKVYNHYSSLNKKEDKSDGSPYSLMEKISNKHSVREEFIRLVKSYTEIIGKIRFNKEIKYLVICIDDIDMVQEKHMDIMQCIHQYFMIPRVIVLVSFNKPVLDASIQSDFFSNVEIDQSTKDEHDKQMHLTRGQAYDFVRKIIPADMRITMPSWKKKDYIELSPIKVDFGKYRDTDNYNNLLNMYPRLKGSTIFNKLQKPNTDPNKSTDANTNTDDEKMRLTPKEMIMLMLADRTSVYLDIKGFKFHFMQPDSLRSLSDMFYLLYNMENLNEIERIEYRENFNKEDKTKYIETENKYQISRKENRKILLDYLHFKMLPENNFSPEIEEFIIRVLDSPMERRGRIIWDYYFKHLSSEENRKRIVELYGSDFYDAEMNRYKIEKYSFGDLYRVLYSATRLNVIDRKVVIFLLASFAFSMPNFVEMEKAINGRKIPSEEPDDYKRIREAFDSSLIGTWRKDLFGGKEVNIKITPSKFKEGSIDTFLKVLSLSSCSYQETIRVVKNTDGTYIIKAKIDPTAFIINSFIFKKRIEMTSFKVKIGEDSYEIVKCWELLNYFNNSCISEEKLIEQCENLEDVLFRNGNSLDFLLKHIDLSYNVIKRVISEMIYTSDNNVKTTKTPKGTSFEIIVEFYNNLNKYLKYQEEAYDLKERFSSLFKYNIILDLFGQVGNKTELEKNGIELIPDGSNDPNGKQDDGNVSIMKKCTNITVYCFNNSPSKEKDDTQVSDELSNEDCGTEENVSQDTSIAGIEDKKDEKTDDQESTESTDSAQPKGDSVPAGEETQQ